MDFLTLGLVAIISIIAYSFLVNSKKNSEVVDSIGDNVSTRIKASTFSMVADINASIKEQAGDTEPADLIKELSTLKNTLKDF